MANNGDFVPKAERSWTKAQLLALLPTGQWDHSFCVASRFGYY